MISAVWSYPRPGCRSCQGYLNLVSPTYEHSPSNSKPSISEHAVPPFRLEFLDPHSSPSLTQLDRPLILPKYSQRSILTYGSYQALGEWQVDTVLPITVMEEPDRSESESERLVEDPSLRAAYSESLRLLAILRSVLFPHPRFHPKDVAINSCFKYMLMLDPAVTGAELEEQSVTSNSTTEGYFSF